LRSEAGMERRKMFEEYADTWSRQDAEGLLKYFSADGVYEDVALGAVHRGTEELRHFFEFTFATRSR